MSERFPSERFLMTVPKPIHDWLSEEADKLGVTVQDRIRVMLEESRKRKNEHISRYGLTPTKKKRQWSETELQEACYSIGMGIYGAVATERSSLQVIEVSNDGGVLYHDDLMIPVISKSFYPLDPDGELLELRICDAARQVAELENKLLSVCERGDKVYQAMPFKCHMWYNKGVWEGVFRVCVNSSRTPSLGDVARVTS